jgi:redox-sensitive bicupin YhaK (pirin superfamily)
VQHSALAQTARPIDPAGMNRRTFLATTAGALGSCTFGGDPAGERAAQPAIPTMRLTLRRSDDRGHADHGWLDSRHTFSFADYHDPAHMGFRALRVINQDRVAPGMGFGTHPHRDMEIFSYVLSGALQHKDSMSAGTGVTHSEFNPSQSDELRFLQIWIVPAQRGLQPGYTEWKPSAAIANAKDVVVISPDGRDGSAVIHQDAIVHRLRLAAGDAITHGNATGRGTWLQLITGELRVGDQILRAGDAASTEDAGTLTITANSTAEALLFDLGPAPLRG